MCYLGDAVFIVSGYQFGRFGSLQVAVGC